MGYMTGYAGSKDQATPIEALLGAVAGSYKKRREQREEQDKEEKELQRELAKLTAIENVKAEHEKKKLLLEGISKGDVEETTETGAGTFEGTPFGAMGKRYKTRQSPVNLHRDLEIQLKQKQLEELNKSEEGAGISKEIDNLYTKLGIPEEEKEDYYLKTQTQSIRGIKKQVPTLERKKIPNEKTIKDISDVEATAYNLENNIKTLQDKGLQLGPGLSTRPGAISDILGQMKGSDFASLKASIGRAFQEYRKWATGVQAGYPELNLLAVNFPKATDNNELFIQKSLDATAEIQRKKENYLNRLSEGGYAISKMRKKSQYNYEREPLTNGQTKTGMKFKVD